jgi:hypothetical protein
MPDTEDSYFSDEDIQKSAELHPELYGLKRSNRKQYSDHSDDDQESNQSSDYSEEFVKKKPKANNRISSESESDENSESFEDFDSEESDFEQPKKRRQTKKVETDQIRFSSRGNQVKYYEDMDLDEEIGSMSDSEEEKRKKREKLTSLEYDQGICN